MIAATAKLTRALQVRSPGRPVPGVTRLSRMLVRLLPVSPAVVTLPNGVRMLLDAGVDAQRELLFSGVYQPALANVLRQYVGSGAYCLDIGANLGYFALDFARRAGAAGRVAAFEANPTLAEALAAQARLNGFDHLRVHKRAVFETSGQALTFYISTHPGKSSLDAALAGTTTREITVETVAIDDFIQAQGWTRLPAIKCDVEGADAPALLGAQASILRYRPFIAFEFSASTAPNLIDQLRTLFAQANYRLELLHLSGKRQPFAWHVPAPLDHIDVLCTPMP
ncbi:MAG: FkbM family methyltransferase [Anaerolineae bacterium]|nr:FkbM family methyltransferase [Anaerolineae bacterium]